MSDVRDKLCMTTAICIEGGDSESLDKILHSLTQGMCAIASEAKEHGLNSPMIELYDEICELLDLKKDAKDEDEDEDEDD